MKIRNAGALTLVCAVLVGVSCSDSRLPDDDVRLSRKSAALEEGSTCGDTAGLDPGPAPMRGCCPSHAGRSSFPGSATNTLNWETSLGGNVHSSPAVAADGTVYVGSNNNRLHALNPDGTIKWEFHFGALGNVKSSPAIATDGTIYVGSNKNKLHALNPDGTLKWEFSTGGNVKSSPTVAGDGTIFVGSNDKKLYAINPDGTEKWQFAASGDVESSPAVSLDGLTVYVGSDDDRLYAVNAADGVQQWEMDLDRNVKSSPAVGSDGTIYVGSDKNNLYAVNPDGTLKWQFSTGGDVQSSPALAADGTIYVGSDDSKLYAVNPDGTEKWNFDTGAEIDSSPVVDANGNVYFGSDDNRMRCVDENGVLIWDFNTGHNVKSTPAIGATGTIFFGSHDNRLHAVGNVPGGPYNVLMAPDDGDQVLIGTVGDDYIVGRAGNDYLSSRGGADILVGGGGADTYDLTHMTHPSEAAGIRVFNHDESDHALTTLTADSIKDFVLVFPNLDFLFFFVPSTFEYTGLGSQGGVFDERQVVSVKTAHTSIGGNIIAWNGVSSAGLNFFALTWVDLVGQEVLTHLEVRGDHFATDVTEFRDANGNFVGYLVSGYSGSQGDQFCLPGVPCEADRGFLANVALDLSGVTAFQYIDGRFRDASGTLQGLAARNRLNAVEQFEGVVFAVGETDADGELEVSPGVFDVVTGTKGFVVARSGVTIQEAFAPSGNAESRFHSLSVRDFNGPRQIVAGGEARVGAGTVDGYVTTLRTSPNAGSPQDASLDAIRLFGGSDHDRVFSIRDIPDGTNFPEIIAAGTTESFNAARTGPGAFLKRLSGGGLFDVWSDADPTAPPAFVAEPGFRFFGGFAPSEGASVAVTHDGGFLVAGTILHPWSPDLLTSAPPGGLENLPHPVFFRTDGDGFNLQARSFGHSAVTEAHLFEGRFESGLQGPALGFAGGGASCTDDAGVCRDEIYVKKVDVDLDPGCSCNDGVFNCGEGRGLRMELSPGLRQCLDVRDVTT